jgi:uncharacterized protein YfaP (DUF2135 family)
MKFGITLTIMLAVSAGMALADDQADRAKLSGKWQSAAGSQSSWTFTENGDSIHIVNADQGQPVADFNCTTSGKECSVKHAGHSSKVSMWFNGSKLVELETTGNQTVKRRFSVSGNGDTMDIETIAVTAGGSPEITHFKRAAEQAAAK